MPSAAGPDRVPETDRPAPADFWDRLRSNPARFRFWTVLVPVHLVAFSALYFGTFQLLENAYSGAAATAARFQLDQAVREMPFLVTSARAGRNPHVFDHMVAVHEPIGLRLYSVGGEPLGSRNISVDPLEVERVRLFLETDAQNELWLEKDGDREWVRGLIRLRADTTCSPCHQVGTALGAAAMKVDFTDRLAEIRALLRPRVLGLLGAWIALIAVVALLVRRTVHASARRLEADLAAAAGDGGDGDEMPSGPIPLDPVSAELHRNLRTFLERQRRRDVEVAHRLAHVDQLASLGQLAAGLAHEIKNPLAGIQGALELLREETEDQSTHDLFGEMLSELRRVHGILQRLLESGRPAPLQLVSTDLGKLLSNVSELLRPSLRRQQIELSCETADELPELKVDPAKIRQVLVNLIQNAAEAMAESGGRVAVRASAFPAESTVVVAVEDDGPGIPEGQQAMLFEPFFTTKFTGTGLGLSISKRLVEQHGARIEVTSEPGQGTTFLIAFPTAPRTTDEPETGQEA